MKYVRGDAKQEVEHFSGVVFGRRFIVIFENLRTKLYINIVMNSRDYSVTVGHVN